jgi:outer membrane protein TolC
MTYKHKYLINFGAIILLLISRLVSYAQVGYERSDSLKAKMANPETAINISNIDTLIFDVNKDIDEQLMPLDSILYYATENSPNLKMAIAETMKFKYNRDYIKWIYLNSVQLFYNYGYGNQITNQIASNQQIDVASQSLGIGYRIGLNVILPLGDLIGRSARLKSLRSETDMAKYKQDEARRIYKRLIIDDYFALVSNQKLIRVKSQDLETCRITAELAFIEMRRGKTQPAELSRLRNIMAVAEISYEQAKRDFLSAYYRLETTLTVPLIYFKKREVSKP